MDYVRSIGFDESNHRLVAEGEKIGRSCRRLGEWAPETDRI